MSNCGKMALPLTIPHFIMAHITNSLTKLWCHIDKEVKHGKKYQTSQKPSNYHYKKIMKLTLQAQAFCQNG